LILSQFSYVSNIIEIKKERKNYIRIMRYKLKRKIIAFLLYMDKKQKGNIIKVIDITRQYFFS